MMNFNIYNGGEEPEKVLPFSKEEIETMNFCVFLKNKNTNETMIKVVNYIYDENVFEKCFGIKKGFDINYNTYIVLKWIPIINNDYNCLFDFHKTNYNFTNKFKLNIPIKENFSYIVEISKPKKENSYNFSILEKRKDLTDLIFNFKIKKILWYEEGYIMKNNIQPIFKWGDYTEYIAIKNIFKDLFPKFYQEYFESPVFYDDLIYITNKLDSYYND